MFKAHKHVESIECENPMYLLHDTGAPLKHGLNSESLSQWCTGCYQQLHFI